MVFFVVPVDKLEFRNFEIEVLKGTSIEDFLSTEPDLLCTCVRKSDGTAFKFSWFKEIEPHVNNQQVFENDFFKRCTESHLISMHAPIPRWRTLPTYSWYTGKGSRDHYDMHVTRQHSPGDVFEIEL
jgi:hypothetical protein